jgi:two-component system heavy metal sensor histidine kinase CusS
VGEVGLRRGRTEDEYREIIGSMLEEAQRLQLLIQRLLELAGAEGGAAAPQRSRIALGEFVAVCAGELGILAEHKRQRVVVQTHETTVETDPVLLRQALQNLLDNAIKYSPDGATIRVEVRAAETTVEICVADEGPGIDEESRGRLMQRFYRPDRGRGRSSGGFGLGLSITKAYMRVLGGELRYAKGPAGGSEFSLVLPRT